MMAKPLTIETSISGIMLRPLRLRDKRAWLNLRKRNHEWLKPWEATAPSIIEFAPPTFAQLVRYHQREAKALRALSFVITFDEKIIGQITLGGIAFGALRGGHIGYWIDQDFAGKSITTAAVVALTGYAFSNLKLHRIEIGFRPENVGSKRVAEKSGYIYEGNRTRFLHIDGDWRDHLIYVRENPLL
ncbi:MAG: GNAT family protein [Actinobacteria bacterium]|nr:GNAT family protein [Actinomycetota bacterium]MDA2985020.1 GNAT family protein [Actinomycetota bacterium]